MLRVSTLQLSLTDVASLAHVQRPVVSMWRRREIPGHPFPRPVAVVAGEERFDALEVVAYLRDTARGNNPEARDDLAAHVRLSAVTTLDEAVAVDGLTALLCLSEATNEALGDIEDEALFALAEALDPDDALLVRELRSLGADLRPLAAHADALADASYSPSKAFEGLLAQHLHRGLPGHAATALQPAAQLLVAVVAQALASHANMDSPLLADVTDGSGDLLLAVAQRYAGDSPPSLATVASDSRTARLTRRRLLVHDLHRLDVAVDRGGAFTFPRSIGSVLHVLQLPPAGRPVMPDVDVLTAIDDLVLGMTDHDRAVVIAPASALTDRPATGDADAARDAILRTGRLRAAFRLPRGLLVRSPSQALALWVLGPAHPHVPPAERWTAVADLSDVDLTESVIDDAATDIVADMTPDDHSFKPRQLEGTVIDDPHQVHGHHFRYARRVRTATILPGRKAVVDRSTTQHNIRDSVETGGLGATVDALLHGLSPSAIDGLRIEGTAHRGAWPSTSQTLGQAVQAKECRIVPGNRLDTGDFTAGDVGRIVIGGSELLTELPLGSRRIDLLTFTAHCPSGRLTEPGDVIFCTSPHPAAVVDLAGGSVVQTPARVLRITDHGRDNLLPEVMAADINAMAATVGSARDWHRWPLRRVPTNQRAPLTATLAVIDREREETRRRLARLDGLAIALRDGVTAGSLLISSTPPNSSHNAEPTKPSDRADSPEAPASDKSPQEGR